MSSVDITIATPARRLERGMVLYENDGEKARVWTVDRVNTRGTVLIAHYGTSLAEAGLKGTTLPDGWRVVEHDELVAAAAAIALGMEFVIDDRHAASLRAGFTGPACADRPPAGMNPEQPHDAPPEPTR